jgi:hypothetical protein
MYLVYFSPFWYVAPRKIWQLSCKSELFITLRSQTLIDEYPIFDDEPNTAFKSLILQFCTFGIAYYFRMIKTGKALGRRVS